MLASRESPKIAEFPPPRLSALKARLPCRKPAFGVQSRSCSAQIRSGSTCDSCPADSHTGAGAVATTEPFQLRSARESGILDRCLAELYSTKVTGRMTPRAHTPGGIQAAKIPMSFPRSQRR